MKITENLCNNPYFQKAVLNATDLLILLLDKKGSIAFINDSGAKLLGYQTSEVLGKDWFKYFIPVDIRDSVYSVFNGILSGKIRLFKTYQNNVITRSNEPKTIHFTNSIVKEGKRIIGVLSIGIDITDYAKSKSELLRIKKINEIMIDTSFKLNKVEEVEKVADIILTAAKKLTDSKYGYVGYIDEETGYFYIPKFSKKIMDECRLENKEVLFKKFRGLWGWSIKHKKVLVSNDVRSDRRARGVPQGHIKIEKFLAIPVIKNNKVIGQIAVANSKRDYNKEDIELLNRLVYLYSLALERAKTKEKLSETLRRFYVSIEASGQIIYIYNLDTKKIVFEGNAERLVGYKKEELPDTLEGVLELVHPEDRERLKYISKHSKDYIDVQVRFRKKDGEYIYVQIKGFTIRDRRRGEDIRYGMVSDISERIKFENEIIKREEEIRTIFENVPIPMVVMDKFKNVVFVNRYFTALYGYEKKDLLNLDQWIATAFPHATKEEVEKYVDMVFMKDDEFDESHNIVMKMIGKDGGRFYIKFYKKNIGKHIVLVLENVTEERIRRKKIDLVNQLLKVNTEINREIARINESIDIIRKVVSILSGLVQFENVYSFSFVGDDFRKLVRVDIKGIYNIESDIVPPCIMRCIQGRENLIVIENDGVCQGCNYYNIRNYKPVIVLPFRENSIFFGCLVFVLKGESNIEEEGQRILEGIAKDIALRLSNLSLQKQNEEYLNRVKSIARFPAENPNPLLRIDRNGILLYANPSSQSILELWNTGIGNPVPSFIKDEIESVCAIGKGIEKEYNIGDKIYNLYIVPFVDSGYANIYFTEITEKKKKEQALKESEERFRKLFDEAPIGYYLQDESGVFIDGNPVAERLVGYKKEELIGKNFMEIGLVPEDKLSQAVEFFRRSIMYGDSGPFEQEIIRKDGSRITLEIYVKYIELRGKKVILGVATDITDRLRLHSELEEKNRELEKLSAGLQEEVNRQTEESRKREQMAIMVKNIVVSSTNLASEDEILRETSNYISELMGYSGYGYYFLNKGDFNVNLYIKGNFDDSLTNYLRNVVLKYVAKTFSGRLRPQMINKDDLCFIAGISEVFNKIPLKLLLVPIVYKDVGLGFMLFFLQDNQEVDDVMMDAFEQISIQLGTIIEQKRVEAEKARLNKLYESVLSSAGDGIIGTDENLNVAFINNAALRILGYMEKDVIGMNVHKLLHYGVDGEEHKLEDCPFQISFLLSERFERKDAIFMKSDGSKVYVNKIVTPIVENDKVTGIVIVFSDITEEKIRQEEINRLATALGQYPVAIGFIDKDGNIKYTNEAFSKHTGISRDELSTMNIEYLNKGITSLIKASPKETFYRQYNFVRKDGNKCSEIVTVAPIFNNNTEVSDYVVIKEDITPHIEIQEAHKLAKEEAERASLAKTAFLATISHEMRTPLTGIDGYIRELAATDLDEKQAEIIKKARINVEHLVNIINDVLDFSKIESGKMEIENRGFDLIMSLERVKSIISIKVEEKGLDFKLEVAPNVHRYLRGDDKRLEQVLINLLSNAVKFTYEGSISVKIEEREIIDGKAVLYFSVKDTGIGIKDEDKIKIFEPFSQADSSISRRFGGTGLGLAISKYFVEKMGGDIWVDSEFGKGSNFQFTAVFEIITPDKVEVEEKFIPPPLMLKGARVLLVEDNEMNQELISNLLKRYGAVVEYADNGRRAVDIIFSKPPDYYNFVLMDIQMPIMDGKTATKIIYENEAYKNLPIIAMTAHAFKDEIDEMYRIGMCAHIPKPFDESSALKVMSKFYCSKESLDISFAFDKEIQLPEYLRGLRCINVREGLSRFSNDVESFKKMLKKFVKKYRNIGDEISKLINEKRYKDAEMIVHTIKGVSGNLSMKGLYETSVSFDSVLKDEPIESKIVEEYMAFCKELKTVVDEVDKIPDTEEREIRTAGEDEYRENLIKLRDSLRMGNVDSFDIFSSIEGNLIKEIGKDNVDKIRSLIENFAYKEALELLESLYK